jgi:seryl-tRNA synthetase
VKSREELILGALRREHSRLSRIAEKAKAEADENSSIGSEFVAIHKEFAEILSSGDHGKAILKRLDELQARRDKAERVLAKDLVKLIDKQHDAESERNAIGEEISLIEFRASLRKSVSGG